jgi:acyl-CoA thioester hydrolase
MCTSTGRTLQNYFWNKGRVMRKTQNVFWPALSVQVRHMPEKDMMQALFFAPFVSSAMRIEPQWIDYNGHLNMAYYHVLFDRAVDEAFSLIGLGSDYVATRNASFFAVECHVQYKRELARGQQVRVTLQLMDSDEKRLHFFMAMREAQEGWIAATSENIAVHVDLATRKSAQFGDDIMANLAVMKTAHARLPRPEAAGRAITMAKGSRDRTGPGLGIQDHGIQDLGTQEKAPYLN